MIQRCFRVAHDLQGCSSSVYPALRTHARPTATTALHSTFPHPHIGINSPPKPPTQPAPRLAPSTRHKHTTRHFSLSKPFAATAHTTVKAHQVRGGSSTGRSGGHSSTSNTGDSHRNVKGLPPHTVEVYSFRLGVFPFFVGRAIISIFLSLLCCYI